MNYYDILGIDKNATSEEIKSAYRLLVKKYHPDVNDASNSNTFFNIIQEAYTTLSDSKLRQEYDLSNSYKNDNTYIDDNYDFEDISSDDLNEYMRTYSPKGQLANKIVKFILKIILILLKPIILTIKFLSTVATGIVFFISRLISLLFTFICFMEIYDLVKGDKSVWLELIMSFIIVMFAYCTPYIIAILPGLLEVINEKINDFIFS